MPTRRTLPKSSISPVWMRPTPSSDQPPIDRVEHAVHVRAEPAVLAERQLRRSSCAFSACCDVADLAGLIDPLERLGEAEALLDLGQC